MGFHFDGLHAVTHLSLCSQVNVLPNLAKPAKWIKEFCDRAKEVAPNYMRRTRRLRSVQAARGSVINHHPNLALTAVQIYGLVKSASLAKPTSTLTAGLPHFATNWPWVRGRDLRRAHVTLELRVLLARLWRASVAPAPAPCLPRQHISGLFASYGPASSNILFECQLRPLVDPSLHK